jgi:hypothetical protein
VSISKLSQSESYCIKPRGENEIFCFTSRRNTFSACARYVNPQIFPKTFPDHLLGNGGGWGGGNVNKRNVEGAKHFSVYDKKVGQYSHLP